MKDQYGDDVPNDLVLFPNIKDLTDHDIEIVDQASWYIAKEVMLISASAIKVFASLVPR